MERENAKKIIAYYYGIPEMRKLLQQEKKEIEQQYNSLGAINMDGMPHGSTPGNPAEALAIKMAEDGGLETLKRIENKIAVLDSDTGAIKEALDALYGKYKKVLILRYQHNYSWAKISVQMRVPDSTVRNWHDRALDRLGEALSGMKKTSGILDRASRARV